MPYIINNYNGQQLSVVSDGTIDETTDIRLIGRNYAGFGEVLNENLVHILQSFAGPNEPPKPLAGQVWYDSANKVIKFYDGNRFRIAGGAETGANAPVGLANGDLWWEEDGQQLYVYNGSDFVLVGPVSAGGEGVSQLTSAVVKDISANDRTILKVTVEDNVLGVISQSEFTLDSTANPIPGFSAIKKGFNLASSTTYPNIKYWGTAETADALTVNGTVTPANQFVLNSGIQSFADFVNINTDDGIFIGAGSDLHLHVTNGDEVNISNEIANTIKFNINNGSIITNVGRFIGSAFVSGNDNTGTLGTINNKWQTVHTYNIDANLVEGDLNGNVTGNVTGNLTGDVVGNVNSSGTTFNGFFNNLTVGGTLTANLTGTSTTAEKLVVDGGTARVAETTVGNNTIVSRDGSGNINVNVVNGTATNAQQLQNLVPSISSNADTIAQRDSNADIRARKLIGTATAAEYADLAENYVADADYEVGTVLVLGGVKEVTQSTSQLDHRVVGVVSENPAHLMNSGLEGEFVAMVALRGRIKVKVTGPVRKGDILITSHVPGTATALTEDSAIPNAIYVIGKSLEENTSADVKLIEIVV
jgi:hypothetical protein